MIRADRIAAGLGSPTFAASAPGDPDRLYITEKETGQIFLLDLATGERSVFFDVPASEMTSGTRGSQGLLGLAFHPDFAQNGRTFLSLNNEHGFNTEVAEIVNGTLRTVIEIPRTNPIHNAGWIGFGPDGLLYIPTGDSGGFDLMDPENAAQNINDLRGKLLRIDVDADAFADDPVRNYSVPDDNAFVNAPGLDEIFAIGLRNPWRASFDRATGDLYIGNVGEFHREEIEYLPSGTGAGTNFGWRVMEGTRPTGYPQEGNPPAFDPSLRPPLLEYEHVAGDFGGRSITGGYVYRGPGAEQGEYFFADFVNHNFWSVRVENGQAVGWRNREAELQVNGGTFNNIASFAEDGHGRLYALGLDGELFLLTMDPEPQPVQESAPAPHDDNDGEEIVQFAVIVGAAAMFGAFFF
jgi:glucose/arabinose dehydrogenase